MAGRAGVSDNRGRRGGRWKKLTAEVRARRELCCRCWQPIDYSLAYPDPHSFSVDHYPHPRSTHPHLAEEPSNLHAAHLDCNKNAGDRGAKPTIGATSEPW
jgi:5-methylcytosine-specific restriction endonuclease McrA